jgi:hypothetical protein
VQKISKILEQCQVQAAQAKEQQPIIIMLSV